MLTSLLKDLIRETGEQSDEEMCEVRSEHRSFCLCGIGVHHPPSVSVFASLEASELHTFGILWRLPHVGMIDH